LSAALGEAGSSAAGPTQASRAAGAARVYGTGHSSVATDAFGPCGVCATPLCGPYCHACGQASARAPRTLHEVFTGQTGKLVYTLRTLLLRPGELAREIDEGRDRRAVRPLTLLLNLVAFFFIVGGGAGGFSAKTFLDSGLGRLPALAEHGEPGSAERARFEERLEHRFQSIYSLLVIVQTLAYGAAIGLIERSRRKPWLVHFAAATHYMCFSVMVAAIAFGAGKAAHIDPTHQLWLGIVMYMAVIAYMTAMLRHAYGDTLLFAFGKALLVLLFGYVVAIVLSLTALVLAVATV